jgi:predicted nucleic acid-binding protein
MAFVLDASVAVGWVVARQATAASTAVSILERMRPVVHETRMQLTELLQVARKFDLSAYDATYLALALELKLPVACSDGPLKAALPRAGVRLA